MGCKWCKSNHVIRYGLRGKKQLWKCKACGRCFLSGPKREKSPLFLTFNYSLGYVVGVLVGDGSLSRWKDYHYFNEESRQVPKSKATKIVPRFRYGFQLKVKDKDFAEEFAKHLRELTNRNVSLYPITQKAVTEIAGNKLSKPYTFNGFKVQLTYKELYHKIKPLKEDLSWIRDSDIEVKRGFLRGLFDSEGGYGSWGRIDLTNKNVDLLYLIRDILNNFNIEAHVYPKREMPKMGILKKDSRQFLKTIGFSIKRKTEKIEELLS